MSQASLRKIVFRIFFDPIWEKKKNLCLLIFSLLLLAASQSLFLLLIGPFLKTMFSLEKGSALLSGANFLSPRMQALLPTLSQMTFEKSTLIMAVPACIVLAAFLKNIASYLYQVQSAYFGLLVAKRFRDRLFSGILNQSFRDILLRSPAEWMSVLMNDVLFLQNKFSDIANGLVRDSILTFAAFCTLFFIHWKTALVMLTITPFIAWGVGKTGKRISQYTEAFQKKLAKLADLVLESRKRFEFIKAHNAETFEHNRFETINNEYFQTICKSIFVRSIFAPCLEFLSYGIFACILIYLSRGGINSHFSATDMIVFLAALGAIMRPLRQIGEQLTQFHETKGALGKCLLLLLNLSKKSDEPLRPLPNSFSKNTAYEIVKLSSGFDTRIMMEAGPLNIYRGQSIAIIGPSGGGKSTLLRTLSGLLNSMHWEGNLSHQDLASYTSFVSQVPFLFDDSILGNLNYGLHEKRGVSELLPYFELVEIQEELLKFNNGIHTNIKAISSNISGGQKQRLVLIRALLRNKSILLLDEATSSIDPKMEENIVSKLLKWGRSQSTSIVAVTHRLSLVHKYDCIWFVENGRVVANGTFKELMNQERFKAFYDASL